MILTEINMKLVQYTCDHISVARAVIYHKMKLKRLVVTLGYLKLYQLP